MIESHRLRITDSLRSSQEYLHAKQLLVERKELQAKLREVNRGLRVLQLKANTAVNLAKSDFGSEMTSQVYSIKD